MYRQHIWLREKERWLFGEVVDHVGIYESKLCRHSDNCVTQEQHQPCWSQLTRLFLCRRSHMWSDRIHSSMFITWPVSDIGLVIWGHGSETFLEQGCHFRISPSWGMEPFWIDWLKTIVSGLSNSGHLCRTLTEISSGLLALWAFLPDHVRCDFNVLETMWSLGRGLGNGKSLSGLTVRTDAKFF